MRCSRPNGSPHFRPTLSDHRRLSMTDPSQHSQVEYANVNPDDLVDDLSADISSTPSGAPPAAHSPTLHGVAPNDVQTVMPSSHPTQRGHGTPSGPVLPGTRAAKIVAEEEAARTSSNAPKGAVEAAPPETRDFLDFASLDSVAAPPGSSRISHEIPPPPRTPSNVGELFEGRPASVPPPPEEPAPATPAVVLIEEPVAVAPVAAAVVAAPMVTAIVRSTPPPAQRTSSVPAPAQPTQTDGTPNGQSFRPFRPPVNDPAPAVSPFGPLPRPPTGTGLRPGSVTSHGGFGPTPKVVRTYEPGSTPWNNDRSSAVPPMNERPVWQMVLLVLVGALFAALIISLIVMGIGKLRSTPSTPTDAPTPVTAEPPVDGLVPPQQHCSELATTGGRRNDSSMFACCRLSARELTMIQHVADETRHGVWVATQRHVTPDYSSGAVNACLPGRPFRWKQ